MNSADVVREAERRAARRAAGLPLHETPEEIAEREQEDDARLEKDIQVEVVRLYRAHGCVVYSTSSTRRSRIAPGVPDLIVFSPRAQLMLFHECKAAQGKLRPDQKDFRDTCIATGVVHIVGGVQAAELAIATHIQPENGQ